MAISLAQPLAVIAVFVLVITIVVIVRALSLAIVAHFGVSGGLVALAALFIAARYLD